MEQTFFTNNRAKLRDLLAGNLCVFTAYGLQQQHNDVAFAFRQESNFYYLTGIQEPDWLLVVDGKANKEYLVAPDIDSVHAVFEGTLSAEDATKRSGVENVVLRSELHAFLDRLAKDHKEVYTLGAHPWKEHFNFTQNPAQAKLNRSLGRYFQQRHDCRALLAKQRAIKQPQEIQAIQKAIDVTAGALEKVQRALPSLNYEYEIEAEIDYFFKQHGLSHAYEPIVAAGANACTLHYQHNNSPLAEGNLVLLDVGAQATGYAADISRTYSLGPPSERQQAVYDAVHEAHNAIVASLRPNLAIKDYMYLVDSHMKVALKNLGLIDNDDDPRYRTYFPHAISHGLGLDVHESLGGFEKFQPGMILTVEPGIYIPEESIGVRIEDNILITEKGNENLSAMISTEWASSSIIKQ